MRRLIVMAALSLIAGFTLANAGPAEAGGVGPKDLSQAGWTCYPTAT